MSLEVLYDTGTLEVRAWCGDPEQFGNLVAGDGQAVVVLPIMVEDIAKGSDYMIDLPGETVYPETPYVPPPDFKALWVAAPNSVAKLALLGKKMGWENE